MIADVVSPFCTRPFVESAFRLTAVQRYTEPLHYHLLHHINPQLHQMPFDSKGWKHQNPHKNLLYEVINQNKKRIRNVQLPKTAKRLKNRLRPSRKRPNSYSRSSWIYAMRPQIRDVCLAQSSSSLWDFVSRPAFESLTSPDAPSYTHLQSQTMFDIATLFFYEAMSGRN